MEVKVDLSNLSGFDIKELKSMVFDLSIDIGKKHEAAQIMKQEIMKREVSSLPEPKAAAPQA